MTKLTVPRLLVHCRRILDHYGSGHQIDKCIEELSELKYCLEELKSETDDVERHLLLVQEIVQEIADVIIMATQMSIKFGVKEVEEQVEYKIKRTLRRIEDETRG